MAGGGLAFAYWCPHPVRSFSAHHPARNFSAFYYQSPGGIGPPRYPRAERRAAAPTPIPYPTSCGQGRIWNGTRCESPAVTGEGASNARRSLSSRKRRAAHPLFILEERASIMSHLRRWAEGEQDPAWLREGPVGYRPLPAREGCVADGHRAAHQHRHRGRQVVPRHAGGVRRIRDEPAPRAPARGHSPSQGARARAARAACISILGFSFDEDEDK